MCASMAPIAKSRARTRVLQCFWNIASADSIASPGGTRLRTNKSECLKGWLGDEICGRIVWHSGELLDSGRETHRESEAAVV